MDSAVNRTDGDSEGLGNILDANWPGVCGRRLAGAGLDRWRRTLNILWLSRHRFSSNRQFAGTLTETSILRAFNSAQNGFYHERIYRLRVNPYCPISALLNLDRFNVLLPIGYRIARSRGCCDFLNRVFNFREA